jgi:hypothetical protein
MSGRLVVIAKPNQPVRIDYALLSQLSNSDEEPVLFERHNSPRTARREMAITGSYGANRDSMAAVPEGIRSKSEFQEHSMAHYDLLRRFSI